MNQWAIYLLNHLHPIAFICTWFFSHALNTSTKCDTWDDSSWSWKTKSTQQEGVKNGMSWVCLSYPFLMSHQFFTFQYMCWVGFHCSPPGSPPRAFPPSARSSQRCGSLAFSVLWGGLEASTVDDVGMIFKKVWAQGFACRPCLAQGLADWAMPWIAPARGFQEPSATLSVPRRPESFRPWSYFTPGTVACKYWDDILASSVGSSWLPKLTDTRSQFSFAGPGCKDGVSLYACHTGLVMRVCRHSNRPMLGLCYWQGHVLLKSSPLRC